MRHIANFIITVVLLTIFTTHWGMLTIAHGGAHIGYASSTLSMALPFPLLVIALALWLISTGVGFILKEYNIPTIGPGLVVFLLVGVLAIWGIAYLAPAWLVKGEIVKAALAGFILIAAHIPPGGFRHVGKTGTSQ